MKNQEMREQRPILSRKERHEILLDFYRVLLAGKAQTLAESGYMGVHRDALVDAKGISQITLAVFRPTPGSDLSSAIDRGTSLP